MAAELPGEQLVLTVGIDHGQFFVSAVGGEVDLDSYTDEAMRAGIAAYPGGFTVFTDSQWTTAGVTVRLGDGRPAVDADAVDHLVETGIELASDRLQVFGPEQTNAAEQEVAVPRGSYSALVAGSNFGTADEAGEDGEDAYTIYLWPGEVLPTRVLKDGFAWMDRIQGPDETPT